MKRRTLRTAAIFFLLFWVFMWASHGHFDPHHDHDECPYCIVYAFGGAAIAAESAALDFSLPPIAVKPVKTLALRSGAPRFNPNAPPTAPPL